MANFTPGPWNSHKSFYPIDADPDTCTSLTDGDPFDYLTISIAKGDLLIGTAAWNSRGDGWPTASSPEECRANAHLMIAAPDMYEALQAMERLVTQLYPGGSEPDDEHLEEYRSVWGAVMNARAALAKADGKQAQS
jgi:hypothetical protein